MSNGTCRIGAAHTAEIAAIKETTRKLEAVDNQQWEAINQIRNRLPAWATAVISLLTFLSGVLLSLAVK